MIKLRTVVTISEYNLLPLQIEKRLEPLEEVGECDTDSQQPRLGCTIFLGFTSNLISSGVRETIRYLVQHKMVNPKFQNSFKFTFQLDVMKLSFYSFSGGCDCHHSRWNRRGPHQVPGPHFPGRFQSARQRAEAERHQQVAEWAFDLEV